MRFGPVRLLALVSIMGSVGAFLAAPGSALSQAEWTMPATVAWNATPSTTTLRDIVARDRSLRPSRAAQSRQGGIALRVRTAGRRRLPEQAAGAAVAPSPQHPAAGVVQAPQSVGAGFAGTSLEDEVTAFGSGSYPPDTTAAVGTEHVVEITNGAVAVFTRSGARLSLVSLDSFFTFTSGITNYPRGAAFAPRIIYDRRGARWVAVALEENGGEDNDLLLAVSRTSDPTGVWDRYVVDVGAADTFTDFPTLGLDDNGVYVGLNMFGPSYGSRIVAIQRSALLQASPVLNAFRFDDLTDGFAYQPAVNFDVVGAAAPAWLIAVDAEALSKLRCRKVVWNGIPALSASVSLTVGSTSFPPFVPQAGGSLPLDAGDDRLSNAVIRNGRLWTCQSITFNSRTAIRWYEFNTASGSLVALQQGTIADAARHYFTPSVTVTGQGHAVVGFSGSRSTEFVGAYFTGRLSGDAANTMQAVVQLAAGGSTYERLDADGYNRWGDYSATFTDPRDDMTVWTAQEYAAATPHAWGTWIAPLFAPTPTLVNPAAATVPGRSNVVVNLSGTNFFDPGVGFSHRFTASFSGGSPNGISGVATQVLSPNSAQVSFNVAVDAELGFRTLTITNPDGATASASNALQITNVAPTASDQTLVTNEDTPKPFTLGASDPDGQTLSYIIVSPPSHGSLSGTAPNLIYTPAANYHGPDAFTFKASDGALESNVAGIGITVASVPDIPIAAPQSVITNEDTAKSITLAGSDGDGDPITFIVPGAPAHGSLSGAAPNLTYTPTANYHGPDAFTFKVNDGSSDSSLVSVNITVVSVNDPPSASDQSVVTNEDVAKSITLGATDVDGDALTYLVGAPSHGALSGIAPNLSYTPAANYHGPDGFTFKVNDGVSDSNTATITLTVASVEDVPVAVSQSLATDEDTAMAVTLAATDGDGDALTYTVVNNPMHGQLSGMAPSLTYTPAPNYHGPDSFTFKANDGNADSNTATVSIAVTSLNDPPVASDQNVITNEDTAKALVLAVADGDLDPLVYTIVNQPQHGMLSGTAPSLTYTPAANYFGPDSFTFKASDGTADSNTATVSLTVLSVNDPPVVQANKTVTVPEDGANAPLGIPAPTDVDGDALTITVTSVPPPAKGDVRLAGAGAVVTLGQTLAIGELTGLEFDPALNASGAAASFAYTVSDGAGGSAQQSITLAITGVNDVPTASGQSVTTDEDTPKAIMLVALDPDNDPLSYTIVNSPLHGSLSGMAPNLTYTPVANYHGSDNFTFKVNDGTADSNVATISITVNSVNDPPAVQAGKTVTVIEDSANTALNITAPTDADGDLLTITVTSVPLAAKGVVRFAGSGPPVANAQTLTGAQLTGLEFDPALNASGAAGAFSYTVADGNGGTVGQTVTLNITAVNDAPTAAPQDVSTNEDTPVAVVLGATDVDGDPLSYIILSAPGHGALSGTAPNLTYTPAANYNGADSFTFRVNDGAVNSNIATVAIDILPVSDAPAAVPQDVSVTEDTSKPITLVATDGDGDPLTYVIVNSPGHGALSGAPPNLTYTPSANYFGPDSFTFRANDGTTNSNTATVSITVVEVNDPPTVQADKTLTVLEDAANTPLAITAPADAEGDPLTISVTATPNVAKGVVRLAGGGAAVSAGQSLTNGQLLGLVFDPAANVSGAAGTFAYTVSDDQGGAATQTITIVIMPVNDPPVAVDQAIATMEDTAKAVLLSGTDPEGAPLIFSVVTGPAHGALSGAAPNLTYTPTANYSGPDSFTFKTNDGSSDSSPGTVSITVNGVNDPPTAQADKSLTVLEDASPTGLGISTPEDVDGDALTITVVSVPNAAKGLVRLNGGAAVASSQSLSIAQLTGLEFVPAANANGAAGTFAYTVSDGNGGAAGQTVTVSITAVNDAPVAIAQAVTTNEDTAKSIALTATDVEGSPLTYAVTSAPGHGTLSGAAPNLTYTPVADYHGPDSFTFKVNDGTVDSSSATITIMVTAVYDPPTADAQSVSTKVNTARTIVLTGVSREGNPLTFSFGTAAHGALSGTAPNLTYTPAADYIGPDSFTFTVNDGVTTSAAATVAISVKPVNEPPVADDQSVSTAEDSPIAVTLSAMDPDASPLSYTLIANPTHGTLSGAAPNLTYTPNANYHGSDAFTFKTSDGVLESNTATVSITVTPVNDPPMAMNDSYGTPLATELVVAAPGILGNDSDLDGDALTAVPGSPPAVGTLTRSADGGFRYTPLVGFSGPVTFTYRVSDGAEQSSEATVTINVGAAPASTEGAKVSGRGQVVVDSVAVRFTITATVKRGRAKGKVVFNHPNPVRGVKTSKVTAVVVEGRRARIYGIATLKNRQKTPFVVDVEDVLNPGSGRDLFGIQLGNGETVPISTIYGDIKVKP